MDYLKKYGISDDDINNLEKLIIERGQNLDTFKYDPEVIINILDLFVSIGVTNIYGIMTTNPSIFRDTFSSIKRKIDSYENKSELAMLLNDDPENLNLIGLL